jgi:hypothetical protein
MNVKRAPRAPASAERGEWRVGPTRREALPGSSSGFFESSLDLRRGLEVSEAALHALPHELEQEFRRLQRG